MNYIKGNYRKSIFSSDKGYVIGLFKVRDTNDEEMKDFVNKTITFTGYFHELNEDDTYFFYGNLVEHPRYGVQYQVTEYEKIKPDNVEGVIDFLSSDLFPGIGEKMAKRIVETLGKEALDKIVDDRQSLDLVPNLSTKKANLIYDILTKNEEGHKTTVYLTELGFNMRDSFNIYNTYKKDTLRVLEHNIYELLDKVDSVNFDKLDSIALKMDVKSDDENRIKACIVYVMGQTIYKNGDVYLEKEKIISLVNNYLKLDISSDDFDLFFEQLVDEDKIIIEDNRYYLTEIFEDEDYIVKKIHYLNNKKKTKYDKLKDAITQLEDLNQIKYNEKQKEAIVKALGNNILIITGGPGTGKTTIIKAITYLYGEINKLDYEGLESEVALLAPTGRASKRMSEATLLPAMTIHRFLKWDKENDSFSINEYNKDYSKLIIVDEVSMIDTSLLASLFKGLTNDIKVVLVGDYNQLPSVGPGQVLKDLIESDVIDTVHLDLLYRQKEDSYIITLANEIKDNDLSENFLDSRSDYKFLQCSDFNIASNLKKICKQIHEKGFDYKRLQVMAPMYAGVNGIDNLNKELQTVFNPASQDKKEIVYGDIIFRENDKILQLVNMPEENIYNGDIGVIKNIIPATMSASSKNELEVDFDGHIVKYKPKDFVKIKHGFIISIHKSQGSEFDTVVIPICRSYNRMLYRKLIYTGITRAKKRLILLGEPNAFIYSIQNNNEYIRNTSLKNRLINFE